MDANTFGSSPSGRYSAAGVRKTIIAALSRTAEPMQTVRLRPVASSQLTAASVNCLALPAL